MELQAASLAQIQAAKSGRMVLIEQDVGAVVARIQEVDPGLRVRYSEAGAYFVVYALDERGDEYLVTTALELDGRLVKRIQEIASEHYDFGAELRAQDDAYDKALDDRLREQVEEVGSRLAHALRKDRGLDQGHIRVPKAV